MRDRQLKLLVGALVILVVAYVGARLTAGGGDSASADFELAMAEGSAIDSVVITAPAAEIRLRSGEGWTVNGHEALPETGESLERALEQARVGQLVSRNPENHGRMGVTAEAGRHVTVYSGGGPRVELIIGDRGQGFDQAYVRRTGEDEVYMLQGNLVSLASRRVDDWRDREILAAERDDIQRIEYEYPEESFALVRDSAAWTLEPEGAELQETDVSGLLTQLSGLRAIGFAADSVTDTLTWEPPTARVTVYGPGEARLGELELLDRGDVGYYARRAGSPVVYTLSSYSGDQIVKRREDLLPEAEGDEEGAEGEE